MKEMKNPMKNEIDWLVQLDCVYDWLIPLEYLGYQGFFVCVGLGRKLGLGSHGVD